MATIRPFKDSDITCKIRWYWVAEGTPPLPGGTLFGSGNWATEKDGWTGPGEVSGAPRPWNNGAPASPRALGQPAGPLEYFREGAPVSAIGSLGYNECGVPLPCVTEPCEVPLADLHSYRQLTTVSGPDPIYPGGIITGNAVEPFGFANEVHAVAYLSVQSRKVTSIGVFLQTAFPAAKCRLGIYKAVSSVDLRAGELIFESGEIDCSVGAGTFKEVPVDQTLTSNTLYWLAWVANHVGPKFMTTSETFMFPILGIRASDFQMLFGFKDTLSFGAFPDPAPDWTPDGGDFVIPCVRIESV